ncbi:MAG: sulfatase-like hydrolase/transferase, partial [Candidatus Eremiobacterota bacterium]
EFERMLTRRQLLQIGLAAALGAAGCSGTEPALVSGQPQVRWRPNLLLLITDQERHPQHWPEGLRDQLMPSWSRLERTGLSYRRAYCASSQCSPSRASMLTGQYSNVNALPFLDFPAPVLPGGDALPNLGTLLRDAGYEVVYKGKWHLSFPLSFAGGSPANETWTAADIAVLDTKYGLPGWNPPDAGNNAFNTGDALSTLGGGTANNDGRYVSGGGNGLGESVLDYLGRVAAAPAATRRPFFLVVSLVNPHDISFFPDGWDQAGYRLEEFETLPVEVPANLDDPLTTKPSVQALYRDALEAKGPLPTPMDQRNYGRFYAHLHRVVEPHIQTVLDALDRLGLTQDTVVLRTADHGELGLSHRLREKSYSAYEEMIHIPLVISSPRLFPQGRSTEAMWSHIDLLATLAELAGATAVGVGRSQVPVLLGQAASVRDAALFCFEDNFLLPADTPGSHLRAVREQRWTYAVYYSPDGSRIEYELYDNEADPLQRTNLLFQPGPDIRPEWERLHGVLTRLMEESRATPPGFAWPAVP